MFGKDALYDFQMTVTVNEVNETRSYFTDIEKFAIFGGSKRTIRKYGENGIGDADIMSEFYQAKQFQNLIVTRQLDPVSLVFRRLYDRQIHFEFNFVVRSLSPDSRFRHLQLTTKKARIIKPPSTNDEGDTLSIKYSDPQVFYWHTENVSVVKEKI